MTLRNLIFIICTFTSLNISAKNITLNSTRFVEDAGATGHYEPENKNQNITGIVVQFDEYTTLQSILGMQSKLLVPPTTLQPLEVIRSAIKPNDDVVMSAILRVSAEKYCVMLVRLINKNSGVQKIEVDLVLNYENGKSFDAYTKIKSSLVSELFKLEP